MPARIIMDVIEFFHIKIGLTNADSINYNRNRINRLCNI